MLKELPLFQYTFKADKPLGMLASRCISECRKHVWDTKAGKFSHQLDLSVVILRQGSKQGYEEFERMLKINFFQGVKITYNHA